MFWVALLIVFLLGYRQVALNMGSVAEDCIQTRSVELLGQCTRDQLLKIAEQFGIKMTDKCSIISEKSTGGR